MSEKYSTTDSMPTALPGKNGAVMPLNTGDDLALERELRILLVDDHDDMLTMMHLLMTRRKFEVITANSAVKAIEEVQRFEPHVIVSDIGMPDMDGYEMMKRLRDMNRTQFKAIALTGFGLDSDQERAHAAGYDAHLTKPVNFEALFEMINHLTGD